MTTKLNIQQRLLKVQSELKAPKGQYNNFGKYKFRSLEDINESVKPLNNKYGITVTIQDSIELIGDRYYIVAIVRATNADDPEDFVEVKSYAREAQNKKGMDESQVTGTASSYARKYAMNGLYLIDDTKDSDTNEHREELQNNQQQQTSQQRNYLEPTKGDYLNQIKSIQQEISRLNPKVTIDHINNYVREKSGINDLKSAQGADRGVVISYYQDCLRMTQQQNNKKQQQSAVNFGGR